jgi:hypothetical protein
MAQPVNLEGQLRSIPAAAALPAHAFNALAKIVYDELEHRVGTALSAGLTDAQLIEFETLIDYEAAHPELHPNGPAAAWLNAHAPHYAHTVRDILNQLLTETAQKLTPAKH